MATSTSVRLPKGVQPVWPDRCVYSGDPGPDAQAVVFASSQSPLLSFLAPILLLFGWRRVWVPVSRAYRTRFYVQNFGRDAVMVVLVVLVVSGVMPWFGRKDHWVKFKVAGLVLVAVMPWILFEVFWPRRFDVTARGAWIDYEFASEAYAEEFAMLNQDHLFGVG